MRYFTLVLVFINLLSFAQKTRQITGSVKDKNTSEALSFSSVHIANTTIGTSSNENGYFKFDIPIENEGKFFIASFVGYKSDTIRLSATKSTYNFNLVPTSGVMGEVVISGTLKETTKLDSPIPVEVYSPAFFKKNPTPSIFEALTMVNGVQPQLNCNVCNTGDIHINGMEGPYTMVLIDGMPIVSSLSTVYGLSGIPNSMVHQIEIVKGPASTLYGSEAVGGLINIITKNPTKIPKLSIDISGTTWSEYNADVTTRFKLKKASSLLGINTFWFDKIHDNNNDGFTDVALQKRFSVFNKWQFERASGKPASIALRYINENRWGGQTAYTPKWRGTDSIYGESVLTERVEVIGSYGLPIKTENIRLDFSINSHFHDSYYGTVKYAANQHTAFSQLLWDKSINNHSLMIGTPFRYVFYDDNTPATSNGDSINPNNQPALTYLPGVFVQDEWTITEKFKTLIGARYDHNNEHGNIYTPRLSFKYKVNNNNTFRLSGGNGYRVVNLFTEDHAALTGSRKVEVKEALNPEKSWNVNLNYVTQIQHSIGFVGFDISGFYTYFNNKIVADYASDPTKIIYDNLKGHAISQGITINADFSFSNGLKILAGLTFMDVFQKEKDSLGVEIKTPQQFAPQFSSTYTVSYTINSMGLTIDLSGKINGPMYLPVLPNDFRPEKSPWYNIMNVQLTKKVKGGFELYGGLKNILNFIPDNPLMRPFDPFNKSIGVNNPNNYTFDTSYNYSSLQGTRGFLGVRWVFM